MRLTHKRFPVARDEGLLVERVGDETIVYDGDSKDAHCLSALAAAVFEHCDGRTSVDKLATLATERLGEPVDRLGVEDALAQLEERQLIAGPPTRGNGLSRREMLRNTAAAGAAAASAPLITSIVVPTAAAAATPTCGDIFCCPCNPGAEIGQPCCIHPTAIQCNCTAKESGISCKQCKPGGAAALDVRCLQQFPTSTPFPGFPPDVAGTCPCDFAEVNCAPPGP